MKAPDGYDLPTNKFCKLNRFLYILKQVGNGIVSLMLIYCLLTLFSLNMIIACL